MLIKLPNEEVWVKACDVDEVKVSSKGGAENWNIRVTMKDTTVYDIGGLSVESAKSLAKDFAERVNKALES